MDCIAHNTTVPTNVTSHQDHTGSQRDHTMDRCLTPQKRPTAQRWGHGGVLTKLYKIRPTKVSLFGRPKPRVALRR